jgi:hypothetical protein
MAPIVQNWRVNLMRAHDRLFDICGAEGRLYSNRGWLGTRCAEHAAGDPVSKRPGFENVRRYRRRFGTSDMYYARYDRETDALTEVSPPACRDTEDR